MNAFSGFGPAIAAGKSGHGAVSMAVASGRVQLVTIRQQSLTLARWRVLWVVLGFAFIAMLALGVQKGVGGTAMVFIPVLVLSFGALVVVSLFGGSLTVLMVVLAMVSWVGFVRTVRAEVFVVKTQDYVQMSIICGASTYHIFIRHLLPGVMHAILVVATLAIGGLILTEATLSFLGAGIPPPTPSWGLMVSEGRDYLTDAWWSSFWPGLAIFLTVMSLNFLGDWLRDFYDPKLRQLV